MLILEDYLLLTLDDETGKAAVDVSYREQAAAGALLVELALLGRADLAGDGDGGRVGRIVVRDTASTQNALLDEALDVVRSKEGATPRALIEPIVRLKPATRAIESLAERGVLRREQGRILGIFPTTRWPAADSRHEDGLRTELWRVLVDGGRPDARTGALVTILSASGLASQVLASGGDRGAPAVVGGSRRWGLRDRHAVDERAREIARESWAGAALKAYVDEIAAAVLVSTTVATTAATSAAMNG
ncbi:GOLPH3/VPS74 family protein [Cellulosimicrobium arenosum]|uniref:GPP34 family phosphoprotein n=1 Tax=Cellulosimicrobium arenosum TaxID=2708133 RepID=A0A927G9L5_9MICO|nr:GPP34 family phosphoprotein [Cellulosimicrobium arenosum]MBD8078972.1 GPP34 family phosphoprotein [Cellulosimicrobium arenosum]